MFPHNSLRLCSQQLSRRTSERSSGVRQWAKPTPTPLHGPVALGIPNQAETRARAEGVATIKGKEYRS